MGLLGTVDDWPGGRPVWLSVFGGVGLLLAVLALFNLNRAAGWLWIAGLICLAVAGVQAMIATVRQGVVPVLLLFGAISTSLWFLISLTGKTKSGPLESGATMTISYVLFLARSERKELYGPPIRTGLIGLAMMVPFFVMVAVAVRSGPIPQGVGPGGVKFTADFQPIIATGRAPLAMRFPEVGPGREIEPGVVFRELRIPPGPEPDQSGKLWLYMPSGDHAPKSLPAVLIAGAGSTLLTGMNLSDGDRAEHLPYVRAGFAVLAYELAGALANNEDPSNAEMAAAGQKFLASKAGLMKTFFAVSFLQARVPEVDPNRPYTAGHSSAGTLAMLATETIGQIKGCVAYAPAIDFGERFNTVQQLAIRSLGLSELATLYSPRGHEYQLTSPIFLFHARDDTNVPVSQTEASADRLRKLKKSVTLEVVPTGGHYDSMIQEGIPRGVAWLRKRAGLDGSSDR